MSTTLTGWTDAARCRCGGWGVHLSSTWESASYECRGTPGLRTGSSCYAPDACKLVFRLHREPEPAQELRIDTRSIRDGVRIFVADDETDTLAIIEVTKRHEMIYVKTGLRGNYTAYKRPIQWVAHSIKARKLTRAQQERAKADYKRRRGIR